LEPVLDKWKYQVNIIELTSGNTFRRPFGAYCWEIAATNILI
jgi:hypothetical protein